MRLPGFGRERGGRMDDEHVSHATEHADLKRGIGPWLLFFFVLGDIVGAGIYALVGEVGAIVGGAIWSAFLCAFILAIFTASSYAELVTKYPRAGGSATYVNNAFNNSFVSFMVAFAVAAASLTSASVVVIVGLINFYGISESVRLNLIFTCVEISGLLLIVLIGVVTLGTGTGEPARAFEFKEGVSLLPAVLTGTVLAFYALIGFDDAVNVAEEVRHPSRIYPRAIFGGLLAAGVVYFLVTFTASMVVPTGQLAASSGPLLEVVERSPFSLPPTLFAGIALIAVSNGALINMIMASRVIYGMADQGVLPSVFSRVHPGRLTPWVSILFTTLVVFTLLATIGRNPDALDTLSTTTVVLLLLAFIMVNTAVLVLRSDEVEHEHFRAPTVLPVLGILVSAALLIYSAIDDWTVFGLAGLLLGIGVVLYGVNVLVKRSLDRETPEATE
jgi:amino acid transporter